MAAAVALAWHSERFMEWNAPLIIDGISYHSAGGRGARGDHKAKLSDVDQLPSDVEQSWDPRIPKVWLGPTIWAQSCVSALRALSKPELIEKINWSALYGHVLVFHPDCRGYVLDAWRFSEGSRLQLASSVGSLFRYRAQQFLRNRVRAPRSVAGTRSATCDSVIEAVALTDAQVSQAVASATFDNLDEDGD
jgi:hypothetical protein